MFACLIECIYIALRVNKDTITQLARGNLCCTYMYHKAKYAMIVIETFYEKLTVCHLCICFPF